VDPGEAPEGFEIRRHKGVPKIHLIEFVLLGVLFLALMYLGFGTQEPRPIAIVGGFAVFAIGFTRQELRFRRLRCPSCQTKLKRKRAEPGEPIRFRCEQCRVIWDTGFFEHSDAEGC